MERVDFVTIESHGAEETLACVFDIDAHSELNLVWDKAYKGLVSRCPDCGVLQKAEEDVST